MHHNDAERAAAGCPVCLQAKNTALRAALDPERIIAAIQLPGGHYCDPQAVADAIRAYCGAALVAHGTPNMKGQP